MSRDSGWRELLERVSAAVVDAGEFDQLPGARKRELLLEARRDGDARVRARAVKALALLAESEHG